MLTRALWLLCVVAVGGWWYAERPTRTRVVAAGGEADARLVRGAFHVHSERSDGSGSPEDIAAAAARAGLAFVILTDHDDATRAPDPPRYIDGVLCIDAVEISTAHGHVVALGLPQAPYPLGGEARDVLEDIARLGGFAVVAHPDSSKADLRWTDDTTPFDGIEWLNGDSEWRDETSGALARALLMYPLYRVEALTSLLDRPDSTFRRWDALTRERRVVALAASDAHARLGLRGFGETADQGSALHLPSYDNIFRMFSNVLPAVTLSGDAATDAASVLAAINAGQTYSVVDGVARPGALTFTATSGSATASIGNILPVGEGSVIVRASIRGPDDALMVLRRDGDIVDSEKGSAVQFTTDASPAVYRVEVLLPDAPGARPVPWIVSNPIYVGRREPQSKSATETRRISQSALQYRDGPATGWAVEHSPASLGALDEIAAVPGRQLLLRYALGGTASSAPYAAFVMPAGGDLPHYDRLVFSGRSDKPARVSVQLRAKGANAGQRWHRSVYLDPVAREISVSFNDMLPLGNTSTPRPALNEIASVLFVLDTVNTPLGGSGTLWLDDVRYVK